MAQPTPVLRATTWSRFLMAVSMWALHIFKDGGHNLSGQRPTFWPPLHWCVWGGVLFSLPYAFPLGFYKHWWDPSWAFLLLGSAIPASLCMPDAPVLQSPLWPFAGLTPVHEHTLCATLMYFSADLHTVFFYTYTYTKDFNCRWLIHRTEFPRWFLSDCISICVLHQIFGCSE